MAGEQDSAGKNAKKKKSSKQLRESGDSRKNSGKRDKKRRRDDDEADPDPDDVRQSTSERIRFSSKEAVTVRGKSAQDDDEDLWRNSDFLNSEHVLEEFGEVDEDIILPPVASPPPLEEPTVTSGKPEVWIRLRPCPRVQDNLFDVTNDGKGLQMLPNFDDQFDARGRRRQSYREEREKQGNVFQCDGVLRNTSQEDTYQMIAHDLVGKAMEGISGLIVSVGPEISGKYFTLFGSISKFQYRGIIPRCLERIFQICATKANEMRYLIRMAIVEIRYDKIRDLLTLGSYDGNPFNRDAPHGMIFQKIGAAEHGFGLLIRALTCQKEIPRETYAKPHTVVFIDIYGESYKDGMPESNPRIVKSRITFAKTAPIPERDEIFPPGRSPSNSMDVYGCMTRRVPTSKGASRSTSDGCCGSTCNKTACTKRKTGPIAEAIRIRQDIGFLEQMCSRACQYQKLNRYYERLAKLGINVAAPPRSLHYRLSKLTYCLKDIVSGNSEIRIILHIRPEKQYKHATLEAMRFAEKVKCVPYGFPPDLPRDDQERQSFQNANLVLSDDFTLQDLLNKLPPEISDLYIQVQPGTFKNMRDQAIALFDSRVHAVEDAGQSSLQELFEKFKSLWTYAMEAGILPSIFPGSQNIEPTEAADESQRKRPSTSALDKKREGIPAQDIALAAPKSSKEVEDLPPTPSRRKSKAGKSKTNAKDKEDKKKQKTGKSKSKGRGDGLSARTSTTDMEADDRIDESEMPEMPPPTAVDAVLEQSVPDQIHTADLPLLGTTVGDILGPRGDTVLESGEVPTKEEAWQEFLHTSKGMELFEDLSKKSRALHDVAVEQSDTTKQTSYIFSRLNNLQKELNLIQQERFLKGDEYDSKGNIIIAPREKQIIQDIKILEQTRDDLAGKLTGIRDRVHTEKTTLDLAKLDAEIAFQNFALDNYAVAYGGLDGVDTMIEKGVKRTEDEDAERIRKFEDIKRVAKKQARLFLRALAKKPSWVPY
ncbi:unnamed protein product [Allacma fusca]|uniref:Kinesin motor domain-containing protein n=1 Tax=Allacma fusca TaxID=39272 RepID=A0A8J2JI01_9HEXA|nr:unnamed protein product [Allacma fusca]